MFCIGMPVNAIFSIYGHSLKALTQQFVPRSRNLSSNRFYYSFSIDIEFDLKSKATSHSCLSKKKLAIGLPKCQMQLCSDNWNQTLIIPLAFKGHNDDRNEEQYTLTPIVRSTHKQWSDYHLPSIKVLLAPAPVERVNKCTLSASRSLLEPFTGKRTIMEIFSRFISRSSLG
jgi:hypothetical protein